MRRLNINFAAQVQPMQTESDPSDGSKRRSSLSASPRGFCRNVCRGMDLAGYSLHAGNAYGKRSRTLASQDKLNATWHGGDPEQLVRTQGLLQRELELRLPAQYIGSTTAGERAAHAQLYEKYLGHAGRWQLEHGRGCPSVGRASLMAHCGGWRSMQTLSALP